MGSLYTELARILGERCAGYHVCLLSGNRELERTLPWPPIRARAVKNGALACQLLLYEVPRA
ncbi:MAG: hypothetical protein U1E76_00450 [Planctomycetota bacterium]